VADIVIRLAQEFAIPGVRCPAEDAANLEALLESVHRASAGVVKQCLVARGVSRIARSFRQKVIRAGLCSPAHFFGLSETGFLDEASLAAILGRLPDGRSELMCHPGNANMDLCQAGTRLVEQRRVELRALTSASVKEMVAREGIHMISYRQLANPAESGRAA
jgi:predicted glycoside hydrolase/deacetylase ChbG (UPF0249 family)